MERIYFLLYLLISLLIGLIIILFIIPAYNSTTLNQNATANQYDAKIDVTTDKEGNILKYNITFSPYLSENDKKIALKHELCHLKQAQEKRLYKNKIGLFFNEIECYIKQWF